MLFSVYDSDLLTSVASLSVYSVLYEGSSVEYTVYIWIIIGCRYVRLYTRRARAQVFKCLVDLNVILVFIYFSN